MIARVRSYAVGGLNYSSGIDIWLYGQITCLESAVFFAA